MAYRIRSTRRSARRVKNNLLATIIIILVLFFVTLNWILPALINGIGFLRGLTNHPQKRETISENTSLAPPVLSIPIEATNSAQIDIGGYSTANSKVRIFVDEELKSETGSREDGSFLAQNIELNLGTNSIFGKTVDDQNQESLSSKVIKIIYDNEKPSLNINEPEDNKKIQGGDKKVKVSGKTEVGVKVFINDSQVIVDRDGNFSSEQVLNEGDNNFNIKALDAVGNSTETAKMVTFQP